MSWKQQHYTPTQSERNQRLIPRLRHLADVVNIKLARSDRVKNVEKEDTHDQQTQSPLSQ
ncbi:MAG: hypothetical protein PHQ43_11805 [Dehalococcoidales bacterium]|nr:hypothetical protein [Dehalococcoidales bacterium]